MSLSVPSATTTLVGSDWRCEALFLICNYLYQMCGDQKIIMNTLLSRLPDRCAFCSSVKS